MGQKRGRDSGKQRLVNPKPFLAGEHASFAPPKSRNKTPKLHQQSAEVISPSMSNKILSEAFKQQQEIENEERDPIIAAAFNAVGERPTILDANESDVDDYLGAPVGQTYFEEELEVNEDDERLLDAFLTKDISQEQSLGDVIAARIKAQDASQTETRPVPKLDDSLVEHYKTLGTVLSTYKKGKLPKSLKHIPAMGAWEELLYLTEPAKWSPAAVFQVTRIFASNMNRMKAEKYYKLVLLPRFREDIRKHQRLHFELYQAMKKALFKPSAFNRGILFPLCKSGNFTLREAVIMGSILHKMSIPAGHSGVALLTLAQMDYCGTTSYIIKELIDKHYDLAYAAIDALVAHFMRFLEDSRVMPVIWHQTLLSFVQSYKNSLKKEDKENLRNLMQRQRHYLVTPEIIRELDNSHLSRGEKDDKLISSPVSVINKPIEEDRFDIPQVPMEEDD